MATTSYIQVPPDSTGKKILHQQHTVSSAPMQVPVHHLVDRNDPSRIQVVSYRGAAAVGLSEGEPSLDAFNNLRVSSQHALGYYDNVCDPQDDLFYTTTTGTSSSTHNSNGAYLNLSVGDTTGDRVWRSTHRYHFYLPGTGTLILQTLALSEPGRVNNTRRWGYGDETNALFWEIDSVWDNVDMNHFSVNIRSNTSGIPVTTRVNRADWNGDKIDGNGPSGFQLTLDGRMFYWIDFAWLGAGPVRFGVLGSKGERIICHTFVNSGGPPIPYMRNPSLPIFWENFNTGPTSGTSDIRSFCSAVYSESDANYNFWRFSDIECQPKTVTTNTHILSMRPTLMFNGHPNRAGTYPDSLGVYVSGGSIKLYIIDNATLTGATWGILGAGSTEGDIDTTAVADGEIFKVIYLSPGCHTIDLKPYYELNDEGYHVTGSGTDQYTFTLAATKLDGTTVQVGTTLTYRELR